LDTVANSLPDFRVGYCPSHDSVNSSFPGELSRQIRKARGTRVFTAEDFRAYSRQGQLASSFFFFEPSSGLRPFLHTRGVSLYGAFPAFARGCLKLPLKGIQPQDQLVPGRFMELTGFAEMPVALRRLFSRFFFEFSSLQGHNDSSGFGVATDRPHK